MNQLILILLCFVLVSCSKAQARWFSNESDPIPEYKAKITTLENHLSAQNESVNQWQIAAGALAIGAVVLFIIGAALGTQTRKQHDSTRRMGRKPPSATTHAGSQSGIARQGPQANGAASLAT